MALSIFRSQRATSNSQRAIPSLHNLLPWFIVGFLLMIALRSSGLIPTVLLQPIHEASTWLTVISMAALGLGVDVRVVAKSGLRITTVVILSLLALCGIAWVLIQILSLNQ